MSFEDDEPRSLRRPSVVRPWPSPIKDDLEIRPIIHTALQSPRTKEGDFRTTEDDLLNRGRRHPYPASASPHKLEDDIWARASTSPLLIKDDIPNPGVNISLMEGGRHSGLRKTTCRLTAVTPGQWKPTFPKLTGESCAKPYRDDLPWKSQVRISSRKA